MPRLLGALLITLLPSASMAATLALTDDPEFGCLMTLDGPIAQGDTETFLSLIKQASTNSRHADMIWYTEYDDGTSPDIDLKVPLNLCLNSPGGALTEAMKLTDAVHGRLGTMVRPGARCESACALVFMAGSYDTGSDIGYITSRHLHVDGKLGFHAPSLSVPEGSYDAASVARAYQVSVAATAKIFRNLVNYRFAPSLAARMHETPPEQMFYVSTVREAARWGISVVGVDAPSAISDAVIRTACGNLYRRTRDQLNSDPDSWSRNGHNGAPVDRPERETFTYTNFGMEALGTCEGRFLDPGDEYNLARTWWPVSSVVQNATWATAAFPDAQPTLFFSFLQSFMAWPGEVPLAALPRNGQAIEMTQPGNCFVYDSSDRLIDREPCTRIQRAEPDGRLVSLHDWPSGARTVIELEGGIRRINGGEAYAWYWPEPKPQGAGETCTQNTSSGNSFCFHPD